MYGHGNIVDLFLLRGAKADILNMGGDSLIHVAAQNGKYDVVMKVRAVTPSQGPDSVCVSLQIMRTHPDVNLANEHGNTPLHYAAFWNFIGICEVSWTEHFL